MLAIEHADMGNRFEVETPHERQAADALRAQIAALAQRDDL